MNIFLLRGIPGSGKSTWVKKFKSDWEQNLRAGRVVTISADDYFTTDGVYHWDPDRLGRAHRSCLRQYMDDLRARGEQGLGGACIVDNTNIAVADLAPYVAIAEALGFSDRLKIVQFRADPLKVQNVHGVPAVTVHNMTKLMAAERIPHRWKHYIQEVEWKPQV